MANEEHLAILKQGVPAWNEWRMNNRGLVPDLSKAGLQGMDLDGVNFHRSSLSGANLRQARLAVANLGEAILNEASLSAANLSLADLHMADLTKTDLSKAVLSEVNLSRAKLNETDLTNAAIGEVLFAFVDISTVKGLETIRHLYPSIISVDTLYRSRGNIPEVFLRGCGVPDTMITFAHSLVGTPIQFYSSFISYSAKDADFTKRLHADLQQKSVRVWFAPEDLRIGERIEESIDQAIRFYDKLMLVLSENSINSAWVRHEVKAALEKEQQENHTVLFPIRLDDAVMDSTEQWAHDIRRDRHIGDFTQWKNHDGYQKAFDRLLRDLKPEESKT